MFQPRSWARITLCPRLEIGKSSDTPCSRPRTIACQYEITRRSSSSSGRTGTRRMRAGEPEHERGDAVLDVVVTRAALVAGEETGQRAGGLGPVDDRNDDQRDPEDDRGHCEPATFRHRNSSLVGPAAAELYRRAATRPTEAARRSRPALAGPRVRPRAGPRRGRAPSSSRSPSGTPKSRSRSKPPSRASSSTRSTGTAVIASGTTVGVEAHRRRQAERVHRAVRQAVAAADGLRHRVAR